MNSLMERWIQACRHELLDRTLIYNEVDLLDAVRVRTPPQHSLAAPGTANARPLGSLPDPITEPTALTRLRIHRSDRPGELLHEYDQVA